MIDGGTYSVISEKLVFCNFASVGNDVEERDEERNHDSESTEIYEPC